MAPAVKPASALDLLLHSRKGPYQALMAREDIRINGSPPHSPTRSAGELERRVQLDSIYFAKSADPDAPRWQVFDRKDRFGDLDTEFKDVLRFDPAGGLKFLAEHAMGFKPKFHFKDVEPQTSWRPYEWAMRRYGVWPCRRQKRTGKCGARRRGASGSERGARDARRPGCPVGETLRRR